MKTLCVPRVNVEFAEFSFDRNAQPDKTSMRMPWAAAGVCACACARACAWCGHVPPPVIADSQRERLKRKNAAPREIAPKSDTLRAATPPRDAAPAATPAHSPSPTWSRMAATVRHVAAARAAAALRAALKVPLSRARSSLF